MSRLFVPMTIGSSDCANCFMPRHSHLGQREQCPITGKASVAAALEAGAAWAVALRRRQTEQAR